MNVQFTELIISQTKTVAVMFCAGIFVESMRQGKKLLKPVLKSRAAEEAAEILFWPLSAWVISMFLYYCSYGRISVHAVIGFFSGLLLWKKMCCDIISPWVKTDEAKSLETTARSSIWKRPESKGWKKDVPRRKKKRKKSFARRRRTPGGKERLEKAGTGSA